MCLAVMSFCSSGLRDATGRCPSHLGMPAWGHSGSPGMQRRQQRRQQCSLLHHQQSRGKFVLCSVCPQTEVQHTGSTLMHWKHLPSGEKLPACPLHQLMLRSSCPCLLLPLSHGQGKLLRDVPRRKDAGDASAAASRALLLGDLWNCLEQRGLRDAPRRAGSAGEALGRQRRVSVTHRAARALSLELLLKALGSFS